MSEEQLPTGKGPNPYQPNDWRWHEHEARARQRRERTLLPFKVTFLILFVLVAVVQGLVLLPTLFQ